MKHARKCVLAGAFWASLAFLLLALGLPAQLKQEPLRATSRLVQVSVIVHDANGRPVTNLKKDDFELLDQGRKQTISALSMQSATSLADAAEPLPPRTFTNRHARPAGMPGSVTVILFDTLNTLARDNAYSQQQIVRFLQQLRREDHVALYALSSGGVRVLHDFSSDPAPLVAALQRYRFAEEPGVAASNKELNQSGFKELDQIFDAVLVLQTNFDLRDRVRRTVDALEVIANHLLRVPGRKNLVWVSGSFPLSYGFDRLYGSTQAQGEGSLMGSLQGGPEGQGSGGGSSGSSKSRGRRGRAPQTPTISAEPDLLMPREQDVFWKELERAARALNRAGLAIYPVDARGLMTALPNPNFTPAARARGRGPTHPEFTTGGPDPLAFDTMRHLAERTGGRAFYNTNDIQNAVREAIDESLATFELAYYPAHGQWDGAFREIKVRVKRLGLQVRHRRGYFAVAEPPMDAEQQSALIEATAVNPLESAALGLTVRFEPAPDAPAKWNLRIQLDAREITLEQKDGRWTGTLTVMTFQKKSDGSTLASSGQNVDLRLAPATYEKLLREGMRLSKQVALEAEATELRVVIRDTASGAMGSVHIPLRQLERARRSAAL